MAQASSDINGSETRRRILAATVGAVLQENGFSSAEKAAVGTLTEILQGILFEVDNSGKMYAEVAYRTEPVIADVILAFAEMGVSLDGIQAYSKRPNRIVISTPGQQVETKQYMCLEVGDKRIHPQHIPDYFPAFPDTHTYCFSHTYKQPITEYEAIREKAAQQKRDIENSLAKFAVKTNESLCLFMYDERENGLVVSVKSEARPYIDALMPRDQVFEEDEEYLAKIKEKRKAEENCGEMKDKDDAKEIEMDNPYLKPVRMPRKRVKKIQHQMQDFS